MQLEAADDMELRPVMARTPMSCLTRSPYVDNGAHPCFYSGGASVAAPASATVPASVIAPASVTVPA